MNYQELIERLRYERDDGSRNEAANAIESLLAENERLKHNLTSTEQTMREYQELAAKRLEEIERLKEIKMAGEIMRDLLKQRDELLAVAEAIEINAEECMDFDDCTAMLVPIDDYHKLMEAIAGVKGGA